MGKGRFARVRAGRALVAVCLLPWCVACGTQSNNDIPEDLLTAIKAGASASSSDYPEGPYGSEPGDVAPDLCLQAWRNPKASNYDEAALEKVCLAEFWDPDSTQHHLLLMNTSATWCGACQVEYGGTGARLSLAAEIQKRRDKGLRVFGTIFQDRARNPADAEVAATWAKAFDVDFLFGVDPGFEMGAFANPVVQPFNMLIDTSTMQILFQLEGDEPTTLWPAVDDFLEQANQ